MRPLPFSEKNFLINPNLSCFGTSAAFFESDSYYREINPKQD